MVGYALRVEKFPRYFYEANGWHFLALYQIVCRRLSGQHSHLQKELGITLATHSTGPSNPSATKNVCQLGEMHLWHEPSPILRVHHRWAWHACGPDQYPSHSGYASPNHSNGALHHFGPWKCLSEVHVGILPYHLAFESYYYGWGKRKVFLVRVPTKGIHWVETPPLLCTGTHISRLAPAIWNRDIHLGLCYWWIPHLTWASSAYHSKTLSDTIKKYPTYDK